MAEPTSTLAAHAPAADTFARAHARLLADRSIQFDLPAVTRPEVPGWLQQLLGALGTAAPFVRWLFWGAVIAGACLLLYLVASRLIRLRPWSRRQVAAAEPQLWHPEAGPARALLREADELARDGRFAEAAHLLLWRSIEDIAAWRPGLLKPALTSRDIARADGLPRGARAAFAQIADAVEFSLFGRRPLDAAAWQACRSAYAGFALDGDVA